MKKALKIRMLATFMLFATLSISIVLFSMYYLDKKQKISDFADAVNEVYMVMLQDFKTLSDFFIYETKNEKFFKWGRSTYISTHKMMIKSVKQQTLSLREKESFELFDADQYIDKIVIELDTFDLIFRNIVELIKEKGFIDSGTEGLLRESAQKLEQVKGVDMLQVLRLRRNEKNYLMRNDEAYVSEVYKGVDELRTSLSRTAPQDSGLYYLDRYVEHFNRLVELENLVGIKGSYALKRNLDKHEIYLQSMYKEMVSETAARRNQLFKEARSLFIYVAVFTAVLAIVLSLYVSNRINHAFPEEAERK